MILQADFSDTMGESNRHKGPTSTFKADIDQLKHTEVQGALGAVVTDEACDNEFCTLGIRCSSQLY